MSTTAREAVRSCAPSGWPAAPAAGWNSSAVFQGAENRLLELGLVAGRTQTFFPWGSKPGSASRRSGSMIFCAATARPSEHEAATIRYLTGRSTTPLPPLPWAASVDFHGPARGSSRGRSCEAMVLYVALDGNDAWSGALAGPNAAKTDGPFATLQRARDEIRKRKARGPLPADGITVRASPASTNCRGRWN